MTFVPSVSPTLRSASDSPTAHGKVNGTDRVALVAHMLSSEGHDASEDGTGRGTPLIAFSHDVAPALTSNYGKQPDNSDTSTGPNLIAFTSKDHGADAGDIAPTLRAMPHDTSDANGGGQVAVAWSIMPMNSGTDYKARPTDIAQPLMTNPVGGNQGGDYITTPTMAVRRLTPTECERLQGFPDGWTALDGVADSTRYRQLGNAVAVPVTEWLGRRIIAAHEARDAARESVNVSALKG